MQFLGCCQTCCLSRHLHKPQMGQSQSSHVLTPHSQLLIPQAQSWGRWMSILSRLMPAHTSLMYWQSSLGVISFQVGIRLPATKSDPHLCWPCRNHKQGAANFQAVMGEVDAQLAAHGSPFFMGADISMPDLVFAPFLERIAASILYYKGVKVRGSGQYPHIDR